ncbi:MAG: cyclic pyranopterin monophosphate synthase MoaC [Sulfolobales archaeon]
MIDITTKKDVYREAVAVGRIRLKRETIQRILRKETLKGDVLEIAKIAGIMAAKKTSELIPLTHQIPLTNVSIEFNIGEDYIEVRSIVSTVYKTGVEIESLVAVAVTLITIWDMIKEYEKDEKGQYPEIKIDEIKIERKFKNNTSYH